MIENRIYEGADCLKSALSSGVTSLQIVVVSAWSVSWGSMKQWPCCILCPVQAVWHTEWKHRIWNILSRLTTIHIDIADSSLLPLLFLKSLCILSGCPTIKIRSCHQDRTWVGPIQYHLHTGFHYSKILMCLCHDYSSFSNISGVDLGGSRYRQVLKWLRC